jgi:hypothetical protein
VTRCGSGFRPTIRARLLLGGGVTAARTLSMTDMELSQYLASNCGATSRSDVERYMRVFCATSRASAKCAVAAYLRRPLLVSREAKCPRAVRYRGEESNALCPRPSIDARSHERRGVLSNLSTWGVGDSRPRAGKLECCGAARERGQHSKANATVRFGRRAMPLGHP